MFENYKKCQETKILCKKGRAKWTDISETEIVGTCPDMAIQLYTALQFYN